MWPRNRYCRQASAGRWKSWQKIWDRPWNTECRDSGLQWLSLASECALPMMKTQDKPSKNGCMECRMRCVSGSRRECRGAEQQNQTAEDRGLGYRNPERFKLGVMCPEYDVLSPLTWPGRPLITYRRFNPATYQYRFRLSIYLTVVTYWCNE